ncbi:MAG: hypothetical protein ACLQBJ_15445 [Bryobacteraceae bacterium]
MLFEVSLPSRIQGGSGAGAALPAWTESISRNRAIVRARGVEWAVRDIKKSEGIILEVDLPKLHPFQPRCIYCEGRVNKATSLGGDVVRMEISIGRMELRTARFAARREASQFPQAPAKRVLRSVS